MSLDVSLIAKKPVKKSGTGVYIREDGKRRELSTEEVKAKWPDSEVALQEYVTSEVFDWNVTHNLGSMADKAGVYYACWRPEEKGWKTAADITPALEKGLTKLQNNPEQYKALNPDNGWGSYDGLVEFVTEYLKACKKYPDAEIEVSR